MLLSQFCKAKRYRRPQHVQRRLAGAKNNKLKTEGFMIINYQFDNSTNPSDTLSWNNAPAGVNSPVEQQAEAAFAAVAQLYDTLFSNNVTINITVQWGVLASTVGATNNGGGGGLIFNYAQVLALLQGDENSPAQQLAFGNLPNTDPTGSNNFSLTVAEAEALGLSASTVNTLYTNAYGKAPPVGTVEFNSISSWTYNTFFNAAAHEISEIMGRNANVGVLYTGLGETNQPLYTPLDLFRYTASGQVDSTFGTATSNSLAYFGYDNGQVVTTEAFNNSAAGDRGDWAVTSNPSGDTFGAVDGNAGQLSGNDLTLMNLVGWNLANLTVAQAQSVYAADPAPAAPQSPGLSLVVADSSSNVSQAMDSLAVLAQNGAISSINFTDFIPLLAVDSYQVLGDAAVFPLISGKYFLSVNLSVIPLTFTLPSNVPYIELTGSGDATITGNALNTVYDINAGGNHTINPGDLGNCTIEGNAGTTTLDYSSLTGNLTVDIQNGKVEKPGGLWTDTFTNVQVFDGGSGTNAFQSIGTGDYTFTGQGTNNTLDYSLDPNGVTINIATDTVTKNFEFAIGDPLHGIPFHAVYYQDSFTGIQTYVGSGGGNTAFLSTGTGDYTFTGEGGNNTLDYSADTNGVTINLATDTVTKDFLTEIGDPLHGILFHPVYWQDSFFDIQTYVGSGGGNTAFQSIANGSYTFTGEGGNNTLDYSADTESVIINLANDLVVKNAFITVAGITVPIQYVDTFSHIQNFVGNASVSDTIDFSGASNQYSIVDNTNGSVTVTDTVAGRDGTVNLTNIANLQFTDTTANPTPPAVVNDSITELYVGYFNRAQDPGGESYWVGQLQPQGSMTLSQIAASFSVQPETTALYPFLATYTLGSLESVTSPNGWSASVYTNVYNFVNSVYENLFNRSILADSNNSGLIYWDGQFAGDTNNPEAIGAAIINIISGAGGNDAQTVANKVTVADYYESQLVSHNATFSHSQAEVALVGVTSNVSTVGTAEASILALL
jgi:hypothetical protein